MTKDDLQKIRVAAADKEDVEFRLDHAELVLQEAVVDAIEHGEDVKVIAEVAEMPVDDVERLAGTRVGEVAPSQQS